LDLEKIDAAIQAAEALEYKSEETAKCQALRTRVNAVAEECNNALQFHREVEMKAALTKSDSIGLHNATTDSLRQLLELRQESEDKFLINELKVVEDLIENGEEKKERAVAIKIRRRVIDIETNRKKYAIAGSPALRLPADWAREKWFSWDRRALAKGMLLYSDSGIHLSLCTPDAKSDQDKIKENEQSLAMFQMMLEIVQLKKPCIKEWILLASQNSFLRTELYFQLLKQLTNTPVETKTQYWKLLGMCLRYLVPAEEHNQKVLELFLMKYDAKDYLHLLHERVFGWEKIATIDSEPTLDAVHPPELQPWEKDQVKKNDDILKLRYCF